MNVNPIIENLQKQGRVNRYPRHSFSIHHRPWQIQPFMIAPVIPGETMKNLLLQAGAYTDPIGNRLMGWHLEHYFFYVKHRDLVGEYGSLIPSEELQQMMLDPAYTMPAGLKTGDYPHFYHGSEANYPNYLEMCAHEVVNHFFRQHGEDWFNDGFADNLSCVSVLGTTNMWIDSVTDDADMPAGGDIGAATTVEAAAALQTAYELLMQQQLVNMSYEDYLRTYGVPLSKVDNHHPELIRQLKQWETPVNAIDPTDGSASAAIKWKIAERADKARYFPEPGWVVGFSVARPKIYMSGLRGAAANVMDTALTWLPAVMRDDVWTSLKAIGDGTGIIPAAKTGAGGYWLDVRDILLYGDQFHTHGESPGAGLNFVDLPATGLVNKYYPSLTDMKNMFADTTNGGHVWQDGMVTMAIAGTQKDYT